jgi:hypothetical protein
MPKKKQKRALSAAEKKLGVELPDDYSAFLRGRGPSAKGGTLFSLDDAIAYERLRLDLPFPFTFVDVKRIVAARARGEETFLEPEDTVGGVLPIADAGCNDITYLVLTGDFRGTVWSGGEPGWRPHLHADGTLMHFREWHERVADERAENEAKDAKLEKKARGKKAAPPLVIDRSAHQLNLRSRALDALPEAVGEMTHVAMVYLGQNELTEVPAVLGRLGTLVALELGPNPLTELPEELFAQLGKLTDLDIKGTQIERLPESLTKMPLRKLTLDDLPQLDLAQSLAVAARIPTLRWLSLQRCSLANVPDGITALVQLERLYLNDNDITELPAWLGALQLEVLGLTNNAVARIPDALEPRIKNLYFAGNPGARDEKKRFDAVRKGFVML